MVDNEYDHLNSTQVNGNELNQSLNRSGLTRSTNDIESDNWMRHVGSLNDLRWAPFCFLLT